MPKYDVTWRVIYLGVTSVEGSSKGAVSQRIRETAPTVLITMGDVSQRVEVPLVVRTYDSADQEIASLQDELSMAQDEIRDLRHQLHRLPHCASREKMGSAEHYDADAEANSTPEEKDGI